MKPKQLYRSDDGAFTMLAESVGAVTAIMEIRIQERDGEHRPRLITIRAGEMIIGQCLILGDVASELFRIEQTLAVSLNTIADERFTAVLSPVPVERSPHP
jgi:hypothetical protein